jgi:DNA-binding CsgD family transcriptional regulator
MPNQDKQLPAMRERVWELHAQGVPLEDIAAELSWSLDTVRSTLEMNHASSAATSNAHRESLRQRAEILRAEGFSYSKIARRFNDERVPTLSGQGWWHHTVIKRLLHE